MAEPNDVDARRVAGYAAAARAAYGDYDMVNDPAGLGRRGYLRGFDEGRVPSYDPKVPGWPGGVFRDDATGAHGRVLLNGRGEMVIAIAGTNELRDVTNGDWLTRGNSQYWAMDDAVRRAVEHGRDRGWKVVFTGHSLGGFPAQMYGVKYGTEAYPFNSGELLLDQYRVATKDRKDYWGEDARYAPLGKITKVNTDSDVLNHFKGVGLGKQYYVTTKNGGYTHPIGSLLDALDEEGALHNEESRDEAFARRKQMYEEAFNPWGGL